MTQLHTLLMIRHGEKPFNGDLGVDEQGNANPDGLIPKGWVRAGALVALFAPNSTTLNSTLPTPGTLVTPKYSVPVHRPYLTLLPLSQRLNVNILSEYAVDADPTQIVSSLLAMDTVVVLVCWEHHHLVNMVGAMASTVQVANQGDVPISWPDDRFDVIWRFDLDEQTRMWTFSSLDQQLLTGDLFPSKTGT
jgi:hypothetical protein